MERCVHFMEAFKRDVLCLGGTYLTTGNLMSRKRRQRVIPGITLVVGGSHEPACHSILSVSLHVDLRRVAEFKQETRLVSLAASHIVCTTHDCIIMSSFKHSDGESPVDSIPLTIPVTIV